MVETDMEVQTALQDPELTSDDGNYEVHQRISSELRPTKVPRSDEGSDTSEDDETVVKMKRRLKRFSDSDSDTVKETVNLNALRSDTENESDKNTNLSKSVPNKLRIKHTSNTSDSDSNSEDPSTVKNNEQQIRMKNKRNKLREKFKNLVTSRVKDGSQVDKDNGYTDNNYSRSSDESNHEISSIEQIKQKIKDRISFKPSICDPDTSDEEKDEDTHQKSLPKHKKQRKSTIPTSPQPIRMSAKQAMENMQKIKSESNRMLREKEVSLPYHRPKALSLKDIMSRRKPAVTADGKALPIKMTEEQLREYALQLEQRQKDIMELCKSDTEDENDNEMPPEVNKECNEPSNSDNVLDVNSKLSIINDSIHEIGKYITEAPNTECILHEATVEISDIDETVNIVEGSTAVDLNVQTMEQHQHFINLEVSTISPNNELVEVINNTVSSQCNIIENETSNKNKIGKEQMKEKFVMDVQSEECNLNAGTDVDSQLISLNYDSEKVNTNLEHSDSVIAIDYSNTNEVNDENEKDCSAEEHVNNGFSDDDIIMEDIDRIIENAEVIKNVDNGESINSRLLIRDPQPLNIKPTLTGAPGMVIDLDGSDPVASTKLAGIELLKERFTYFARLKTPEELERERERKLKPGTQHSKLKHELEEQIAEQRSLEWAKRLEEEKQQQMELKALRGEDSDDEDDIEKMEAKLEENEDKEEESSEEEEEQEIGEVEENPRKKNPLIADEAEESDCDEADDEERDEPAQDGDENTVVDEQNDDKNESSEESSDDDSSSSDSEYEQQNKIKKGRILKAFEDSDDEETSKNEQADVAVTSNDGLNVKKLASNVTIEPDVHLDDAVANSQVENQVIKDSQDDELQLAQKHQSASDDLFTSQGSDVITSYSNTQDKDQESELGTQTFSILNTNLISATSDTNTYDDRLGGFSQNIVPSQIPKDMSQCQSQPIGEDILALCTGNFYDNQFVSPSEQNEEAYEITQDSIGDNFDEELSQKPTPASGIDFKLTNDASNECKLISDTTNEESKLNNEGNKQKTDSKQQSEDGVLLKSILEELHDPEVDSQKQSDTANKESKLNNEGNNQKTDIKQQSEDGVLLKSILEELHDPEFDSQKPNKYFFSQKESDVNIHAKRKFIIDSDDETNETNTSDGKKKKLRKKKPEKRALQISDDEESLSEDEAEEYMSDIEDETDRIVEYDSEENEVEVKPQNPKKKRKMADFFEQEAELTSEDEWVGSGDEDEAGLDRMEREAGDDETFHQGKLQSELGQIHIRDVLDQDKREVRMIQELLFEDGDLGDGHRQRKFRWKDADGEETGTIVDELADTQEEEFESEEQWRKQRHEREVFLRQMQSKDDAEVKPNVSVNRKTIIKANLCSKTMSSLLMEVNTSNMEKTEISDTPAVTEKKSVKDIPSPKKAFTIFQQNYHSSLLTRGRGALARLAALATPLAIDDDAPKVGSLAPTSRRNFVFTTVTRDDDEPKVTKKRKADTNVGTPKLVKKLKTEEKQTFTRNSLLDYLKA